MKYILSILFAISFLSIAQAQDGKGSFVVDNGSNTIGPSQFDVIYTESIYIGPDANWVVDGQLDLYCKNIWIAPTAKISGTGVINIHNPGDNPLYESWTDQSTNIDGNNSNFIDVAIVVLNNRGLSLKDIDGQDLQQGTFPTGSKSAALRLGKTLDLRVDGAYVFLNGHDLELTANASFLNANYRRHVVTDNPSRGQVIKHFDALLTPFIFPVGKEAGDYTPARLKPTISNTQVYVSVTDYLSSGLRFQDETIGMDRVWNIFANKAQKMDYTLTHNMSSNGIAYVDENAQIVQNADGGNWIGNVTLLEATGIHTRRDIESKTTNTLSGTWFTKFSMKPPVAVDDFEEMKYGEELVVNVLENDVPGSAAIVRGSVAITIPPKNGTVTVIDGNIIYRPNDGFIGTDDFEYRITDENGLSDTAKVEVTVAPRELFMPNVITPNGDGKNDKFVVIGLEEYDRLQLIVINVWGNEVYSNTTNYQNDWSGQGLNEGTYFYILTAIKGREHRIFKGHVLIKRN